MKWLKKAAPMWLVVLLIAALIGMGSALASVTIPSATVYTTIGGEVVTVTEDLTPAPVGVDIPGAVAATALGQVQGSPVLMAAAGGSVGNEAITVGHYAYNYKLTVATVDFDQVYSVELFADGSSQGILYVAQDADGTATIGDNVTLTWDLGASLADAVYTIEVLPL